MIRQLRLALQERYGESSPYINSDRKLEMAAFQVLRSYFGMLVIKPNGTILKVANGAKNYDKEHRVFYNKPVVLEVLIPDQA